MSTIWKKTLRVYRKARKSLGVQATKELGSGAKGKNGAREGQRVDTDKAVAATLDELLVATHNQLLWLPIERVRMRIGIGFSRPQNPFVRYLFDGAESLQRYYELHQPRNPLEAAFLRRESYGSKVVNQSPKSRNMPWSSVAVNDFPPVGFGNQFFGPAHPERVAVEAKRLNTLLRSITQDGYWVSKASRTDYVVLVDDSTPRTRDYRVIVQEGNHRIAVLAYLGWSLIPLTPKHSYSGIAVYLSDLNRWPGVLDGTFTNPEARDMFLAFFRDTASKFLPGW